MDDSVIAIIPARSGSKGLPRKNLRQLCGHPLLAWSIAAAKLTSRIKRVLVSTDSHEYAKVAQIYGAETPFIRPPAIATDAALDIGFVMHALLWIAEHEGLVPSLLVHLRPTCPLRDPILIDHAIEILLDNPSATSLCSVHLVASTPYKFFSLSSEGTISGLMGEQYVNLPRQACPEVYQGNGHVDVLRPQRILETANLYGNKRLAFFAPPCGDIDTQEDFEDVNQKAKLMNSPLLKFLDNVVK